MRQIMDIEWGDLHRWDYPDFADAYIVKASWKDTGKALSNEELDQLNEDRVFIGSLLAELLWHHI